MPTDEEATRSPIADCCEVDPRISRHFNGRIAELTSDGDLPEMVDVSRMLLGLLAGDVESRRPTLLELGCGSGALMTELVSRGAERADGVDLSPDMVGAARRRAEEAGVTGRVFFTLGDGAVVDVEPHDWVVMDRVICCYPAVERLLANATRAATERVAFTVPTSRGWRGLINKVMWRFENVPLLFGRPGCPGYVHDLGRIERTLAAAGFALHAEDRLGLWHAAVWDRTAAA
jgi:magnesium-protoporphyrin O-methyltransferase